MTRVGSQRWKAWLSMLMVVMITVMACLELSVPLPHTLAVVTMVTLLVMASARCYTLLRRRVSGSVSMIPVDDTVESGDDDTDCINEMRTRILVCRGLCAGCMSAVEMAFGSDHDSYATLDDIMSIIVSMSNRLDMYHEVGIDLDTLQPLLVKVKATLTDCLGNVNGMIMDASAYDMEMVRDRVLGL